MKQSGFNAWEFSRHLRISETPLKARRTHIPALVFGLEGLAEEVLHREAYERDPELYALSAVAARIKEAQRAWILFQLLRSSRSGFSQKVRKTLDRTVALILAILPAELVLAVFLALRRVRANHKHTTHAVLSYLFGHPCLKDMAARRRPALVDCLEHALGRDVARGCLKQLMSDAPDEAYLRRRLGKFEEARAKIPVFYSGKGDSLSGDQGSFSAFHKRFEAIFSRGEDAERPKTVTATNRGDISATLVHIYRGGKSPALTEALREYVERTAQILPKFEGKLAVVLDASASTRGYGEREFCCISQSVALCLVLARCCPKLEVFRVGGNGEPPVPGGETDLAAGVLRALASEPDLVAVITDGYENLHEGDLAKVTKALPQAGIACPVVLCHSKFTPKDDLSLRRPAPNLWELEFWHEADFRDLCLSLFSLIGGEGAKTYLQEVLTERLGRLEEVLLWNTLR